MIIMISYISQMGTSIYIALDNRNVVFNASGLTRSASYHEKLTTANEPKLNTAR